MAAGGGDFEHFEVNSLFSEKYRWAGGLLNRNANGIFIKFVLSTKKKQIEVARPKDRHFSQTFKLVHLDRMDSILSSCATSDFLSTCLIQLECDHPAEPFFYFGADLLCTRNYQTILTRELKETHNCVNFTPTLPSQRAKSVGQLISVLHKYQGRHLLSSMVNSASLSEQTASYPDVKETMTEFSNQYQRECDVTKQLFDLIRTQAIGARSTVIERIKEYGKEQLKFLAMLMIYQDSGDVIPGYNLSLPFATPPRANESTSRCIPDIIYESAIPILICDCGNYSQGLSFRHNSQRRYHQSDWANEDLDYDEDLNGGDFAYMFSEEMCMISCTVLWELYQQMLGMMIQVHEYTRLSNPKKVFQAGMLIKNDKIIVCILVMDYKVFRKIRKKENRTAENCMRILRTLSEDSNPFCNFYVLAKEHDFHEMGSLSKSLQTFFCKIYE